MKKNVEANQNPNYFNQSYDIQIPSLYRLAERNFLEETDGKKMRAFLEKIIKDNKHLEYENSLLKEIIQEKEEIINAQKQKLINYDFIVKTCIKNTIMESQKFFASTGNQNGVNLIDEILKLNEDNTNNINDYSDESAGTNNGL